MKTLTFFFAAALAAFAIGCSSEDGSTTPSTTPITETDLYPFVVGRTVTYSDYLLDTTSSAPIPSTAYNFTTYVQGTVTRNGKQAFALIDSVYAAIGAGPTIEPWFAAVENGDLLLEFDGEWRTVFKRSAGVNASYFVRTYNDSSMGFAIPVTVNATILPKEQVTTPAGTYEAYKLRLEGSVSFGAFQVKIPVYSYFAPGIGLIKQTSPVFTNPLTAEKTEGEEYVMTGKNF